MRLLLINPNTTQALTSRLASSAGKVLPPDVELLTATARTGFPYISSLAEAQLAGAAVLEVLAQRAGETDAAVIAAFGDPGLHAARELFDMPVTGMAEAAMIMSLSLGARFAFVTFTPRLVPWYEAQVIAAGLGARFGGTFVPSDTFRSIESVSADLREPLVEVCRDAARSADVLILAGAPIAGLAETIAADVPAILVDPVQAAVLQAVGSFARPPGKPGTGLPTALASWFGRGI
jgi:Asp/Glu/hydantoin racemase